MSFHNPGSWLWLIAAVLVAAMYLWNYTSQNRQVAAYWLWQKALARRPAWIGLRRGSSVTVQVLIVLLVVTALAEPYWTSLFTARRNVVLVLDVSASMSVAGAGESRFEQMRELATQAVQNLRRGERLAIITAASEIRALCPLTDDQPALLAAIAALEPSSSGSRIQEAVEAAKATVAGLPNARVTVISDGCFPGAMSLAEAEDARLILVGEDAGNTAITRFQVVRDQRNPSLQHFLVEVANQASQPFSGKLELRSDRGIDEQFTINVPAREKQRGQPSFSLRQDSLMTVRVTPEDAMPEDNTAWLPVRSHRWPMVTLISGGFQPLKSVMEGLSEMDLTLADSLDSVPHSPDVLVIYGQTPEVLPPGAMLVIEPQNSCDLWEVGAELRGPGCAASSVATGSELLRGVDATGFVVERSTSLAFASPVEPIIATESGNLLYADIARPSGRVLVLNVPMNRERSDLILRPDLAQLIDNAVRALSPPPPAPAEASSVERSVRLEPGESPRQLQSPRGDAIDIPGNQAFVRLTEPGVWKWGSGDAEGIPVNAAAGRESDLRRPAGIASDELELLEPVHDQPLWMLLIGLALIVLTLEWCLYHRRYLV